MGFFDKPESRESKEYKRGLEESSQKDNCSLFTIIEDMVQGTGLPFIGDTSSYDKGYEDGKDHRK